jgi:hypothetical protein
MWIDELSLSRPNKKKVIRRAYNVFGIYDRFLTEVQFNHKF